MIASLSGKVLSKHTGSLILDVSGVGFALLVPQAVSTAVSVGEALMLHTTLIVREDAFTLFGFSDVEQLALFEHLRSVSGVGPKTALAAISTLTAGEIANAVANEDSAVFQRVSGIGAKTAKLIAVSLSGKLTAHESSTPESADLLAAMQSLGWPERVAEPVVREVLKDRAEKSFTELVRACLLILGGSK